jgi:hypothetical protein
VLVVAAVVRQRMVLMVDRRNQRQMVRGMEHRITTGLERAVLIRTNWWRVLELKRAGGERELMFDIDDTMQVVNHSPGVDPNKPPEEGAGVAPNREVDGAGAVAAIKIREISRGNK